METEKRLQIQQDIKAFANELGADMVGFSAFETPPSRLNEKLSYAICIGVKLSDAVLATIETAPSFVYFQHYRTANALLDSIVFRIARKIEEYGYLALPIAASQSQGKNEPYRGVIPLTTSYYTIKL